MIQIANAIPTTLQCKLCNRKFGTVQTLERHQKKKIPCDRVLSCEKCDMKFKRSNDLKKHQNRKTPCEPIQGDTTIKFQNDDPVMF